MRCLQSIAHTCTVISNLGDETCKKLLQLPEQVLGSLVQSVPLKENVSVHDEIDSRLKSGSACYHSVQNLLPSSLLSSILGQSIKKPNF